MSNLYILFATDKPGVLERRKQVRPFMSTRISVRIFLYVWTTTQAFFPATGAKC